MKTKLHSAFCILHSTFFLLPLALLTTSPRALAQSPWGNALSFDGVDDYVGGGEVPLANSSFTLEAWARRHSSESIDFILGQGGGGTDRSLHFGFHYESSFVLGFYDDDLWSAPGYTATDWHHWAGTYNATNRLRCLYRDGVLIATNTASANYQGSGPLTIGTVLWGPGAEFDGEIDDVRVWSVARSQAQIAAQMSHPLAGTEPNLLAYWKFDEGTGTTASDATTNGYHGTLVNGPVWANSTIPSPFTNINAGLLAVSDGSVAWGDYDNDGRLDFLLTGSYWDGSEHDVSQLWRNTGSGFTDVTATVAPGLPGVAFSSVAWGDYDNDGRLDFLLTGWKAGRIAQVWRNTGSGFTDVTATVAPALPAVNDGSVAWGDYDNDGRLDLLLTGTAEDARIAQVWRNTGSGFTDVTATVAPGLPGVTFSSVAWGDYDNDGRLDFLLTGTTNDITTGIAQVWRNTGSGFTNVTATVAPGLPGVCQGSVAWGDYDNDGRLDLLLTGWSASDPIAQVWRNTGSGFTNLNAGLPGVYGSSVAWGDYDNDGRLDLLLTGFGDSGITAQVWQNTGSGFTDVTASVAPGLPGVVWASVAWGDYDNDGRLDLLLTGETISGPIAQVWRNTGWTTNTPPAPPSNLAVTATNSTLAFSWTPASDAETPAAGLTYNLRVGTTPGGSDIVSPHAASNGGRQLPALGNAQQRLSFPLASSRTGRFYWTVQAVDTAFVGGPFAPERSFTLWTVLGSDSGLVPGDSNGDGVVDSGEFANVLPHLNGNGSVTPAQLRLVMSNYYPYVSLSLTNTWGLGGETVSFALPRAASGAFSVLVSSNLVDWDYLGPALPRYGFTDPNAAATPKRFYRLSWP